MENLSKDLRKNVQTIDENVITEKDGKKKHILKDAKNEKESGDSPTKLEK